MLILTRRVGETLMVGDDVTVTVLGVKGNQVRIGINAPKDTAVHREEVYNKIKQEPENDGHKKPGLKLNSEQGEDHGPSDAPPHASPERARSASGYDRPTLGRPTPRPGGASLKP